MLCMCTCFFHRYLIEDFCVLGSFEVYHINFGWGSAHSVPDKASLMIFFFSFQSHHFSLIDLWKYSSCLRNGGCCRSMSITGLKFEPTEPIWECEWGKGCPDCFHMCAVFFFFCLFRSVSSCFLVICKLSAWLCIGEFSWVIPICFGF